MNLEISKGLEIAEKANNELCGIATRNDLDKQKEIDKDAETHRTVYRRERDRILYSGGFRRLQDKTQVIAAVKTGDHRTRLTHSLEVEQIAISIADALRLNKDLTSAIALGHDIGHTPFGHAVERFLDEKLVDNGGFSHALESVRYINNNGIEISDEIIEGILKHDTDAFVHKFEKDGQLEQKEIYHVNEPPGTLEAQIVYWADKIAYITHDYEDFMKSDLLYKTIDDDKIEEIELEKILLELIGKNIKLVGKNMELIDKDEKPKKYEIRDLIRDLVRSITKNLIVNSKKNINECFAKVELQNINENRIEKQNYIRDKTIKRIEKYTSKNKEYNFLKSLKLDDLNDEEISIELNKAYEFYYENDTINQKMLEKIKKLQSDIMDRIKLEKEIDTMCNIEMLRQQEKITRYRELNNVDLGIFGKEINGIKMKSYQAGLIINLSDDYREKYLKLRKIMNEHYIGSSKIQLSDAKAKRIISSLFNMYHDNSDILPNEIKDRIKEDMKLDDSGNKSEQIKLRNIASYIASMSDRYAEQIYNNLNSTGSHYDY